MTNGPSSSAKGARWLLSDSWIRHPLDGPLPLFLLLLALVSGIADALSFLELGRVFVANMTGNVVIMGLGFLHVKGVSLLNAVSILVAFGGGAAIEGAVARRSSANRPQLLTRICLVELALIGCAALLAADGSPLRHPAHSLGIAVLLAFARGFQSGVQIRLNVADISTTYLTALFTNFATQLGKVPWDTSFRRVISVISRAAGAVMGATLILYASYLWAFGTMLFLIALTIGGCSFGAGKSAPWKVFRTAPT